MSLSGWAKATSSFARGFKGIDVLRARQALIEKEMLKAEPAQQAALLQKWIQTWKETTRLDVFPHQTSWVQAINHIYRMKDGGPVTEDILGALVASTTDPKKTRLNPLEAGSGLARLTLANFGAVGMVIGGLSQIFGGGGVYIDWDWVLGQVRKIVREELQQIRVDDLGAKVKSLGDWVAVSLVSHSEWMPNDGSQFQDQIMEAQKLAGALMYTNGTVSLRAGALSFFIVAANLHTVLLMNAAERVKQKNQEDAAKGYAGEVAKYLGTYYIPHAKRVMADIMKARAAAIGPFESDSKGNRRNIKDVGQHIYLRLDGDWRKAEPLYRLLIPNFMQAALIDVSDTCDTWSQIRDKVAQGHLWQT